MKKILLIISIGFSLFTGCNSKRAVDKYEIGNKLTLDLVKKSDKIFFHKNYLIFLVEFTSDYEFQSDLYLFFYDKDLKLHNKALSEGFSDIDNDTVFLTSNIANINPADFPKGLSFRKVKKNTGSTLLENKILTDFSLNKKTKIIDLYVKKSDSIFEALNMSVPIDDSILVTKFPFHDTLSFNLSDLYFERSTIVSGKKIYADVIEIDKIHYQKYALKERLYNEIWKLILDWK